jgi:hypothetical protein
MEDDPIGYSGFTDHIDRWVKAKEKKCFSGVDTITRFKQMLFRIFSRGEKEEKDPLPFSHFARSIEPFSSSGSALGHRLKADDGKTMTCSKRAYFSINPIKNTIKDFY